MAELRMEDTIAALATPPGEGALAILRLSGPSTFQILEQIFHPSKGEIAGFQTHSLRLGNICDPTSGFPIDHSVIGIFRAPHSYTGEDVAEIYCHGGTTVTRRILEVLLRSGARHAEPGEFTRRAFLNHKLDLVQAEAVLDLIRSKSDGALRVASRQLAGALSDKFHQLKSSLMKLLAHIEAYLDFPDDDIEVYSSEDFRRQYQSLQAEIKALRESFSRGVLLREGALVAITGKPNVGKSSLFNALLSRDRALVSTYAGTTRDVLEESLEIGGWRVRLMDTAGLCSEAVHPLDALGMNKTRSVLEGADIFFYLIDGSSALEAADRRIFQEIISLGKTVMILVNKADLGLQADLAWLQSFSGGAAGLLRISAKTGEGIEKLHGHLLKIIQEHVGVSEGEQITRIRHKDALQKASEALHRSQRALEERKSLEFVALDLKAALDEMRELVGEIYSEDLLDVIFSEFCIGK
ncbi:MAG: tRNA uridine-5-carboxymethylaminomethyl(34) synthesis GTPase MnmE [Candidatus Omnitrophica bacterium]|nr:tRNA uridine-5-carboxymethylaminomethyl(34) synthesis GTPase MnmE [Candidatus Omnitrophota bacterium]